MTLALTMRSALGLIVLALSPFIAQSAIPGNQTEACVLLQDTIWLGNNMGSYCDPAGVDLKEWYVFAFHGRHPWYDDDAPKTSGTDDFGYYLVGWFAIKKSNGRVHYFDIKKKKIGARVKQSDWLPHNSGI